MVTRQQREGWRADRRRISEAGDKVRNEPAIVDRSEAAPLIPADRDTFVGLLDELATAAGRGELSPDVLRVSLELSDKLMRYEHTP